MLIETPCIYIQRIDEAVDVQAIEPALTDIAHPLGCQFANARSASVAYEVDEFQIAGLTPAPSRLVSVRRVAESPVNFECRITELIQLKHQSREHVAAWLVPGEVIRCPYPQKSA
jgi:flavin reductase (DIM6/NTAB) family NADH-FMN oxidoreductase RutF